MKQKKQKAKKAKAKKAKRQGDRQKVGASNSKPVYRMGRMR